MAHPVKVTIAVAINQITAIARPPLPSRSVSVGCLQEAFYFIVCSVHLRAQVLASETRFQTHCQCFCSRVRPKSVSLQTIHEPRLRLKVNSLTRTEFCTWKEVHWFIYSVKVITMSRLTINHFLILWALHGSLRCCETDRETGCATLLSLETQDIERG